MKVLYPPNGMLCLTSIFHQYEFRDLNFVMSLYMSDIYRRVENPHMWPGVIPRKRRLLRFVPFTPQPPSYAVYGECIFIETLDPRFFQHVK